MPRPIPDPIPLTQPAYNKIQSDFHSLSQQREHILIRLQTAREMGDLSENGAYKYAKFELRDTDRKLKTLRHLLRYGQVVSPKLDGTVNFGNSVTIKNPNHTIEFTLVSSYESNPSQKKLSLASPFGRAVIGKKVGDQVTIDAPSGQTTFTITRIT